MTARARRLGFLLIWGFSGLPRFGDGSGPYGPVLNRVAVPERHATNVVAAVTFDYRGIDTMGEEFILFAAVIGVAILLRAMRGEAEHPPEEAARGRRVPGTSNAVRVGGLALLGPIVLFGIYVVTHGHLTPGGGFQGGVVLASGAFLANALPFGVAGTLLSAGTIPVINLAVGLEVAAGFTLLLSEFLEQTLVLGPGRSGR